MTHLDDPIFNTQIEIDLKALLQQKFLDQLRAKLTFKPFRIRDLPTPGIYHVLVKIGVPKKLFQRDKPEIDFKRDPQYFARRGIVWGFEWQSRYILVARSDTLGVRFKLYKEEGFPLLHVNDWDPKRFCFQQGDFLLKIKFCRG